MKLWRVSTNCRVKMPNFHENTDRFYLFPGIIREDGATVYAGIISIDELATKTQVVFMLIARTFAIFIIKILYSSSTFGGTWIRSYVNHLKIQWGRLLHIRGSPTLDQGKKLSGVVQLHSGLRRSDVPVLFWIGWSVSIHAVLLKLVLGRRHLSIILLSEISVQISREYYKTGSPSSGPTWALTCLHSHEWRTCQHWPRSESMPPWLWNCRVAKSWKIPES